MPINLKPVDVAMIGLGAAAGVAVLPKVTALEASSKQVLGHTPINSSPTLRILLSKRRTPG
jgi:hypothetical protein